ncbi:hypothetical protein V6N13_127859 [Hibiscus sabdariffa]
MRIVLNQERKEYVTIKSVPNEPGTNSPRASKDKFEKHIDDMLDVGCLVLATITLELQKQQEYSSGSTRHQDDGLHPNVGEARL